MDEYIQGTLSAGIIHPSSSSAGPGLLFVEKKDKTLQPCTDYCGLNDITLKNHYPLSLFSSAFELLQGPQIFTKLNLRNTFGSVRGTSGKQSSTPLVSTMSTW